MTSSLDIHRQAFKEEAYELLAELEISLLEWEKRPDDEELIGRVFRAMHTIKGSGAMFGFDDVAGFAHEVETVLDLVRAGRLAVTREMHDLILAARDLIKMMIEATDGGEPVDEVRVTKLAGAFRGLQTKAHPTETTGSDHLKTAKPDISSGPMLTHEGVSYRIRFKPSEDIFQKGTNPLLLLDELRSLGETKVVAHTDAIPDLELYDPAACYTYWDIILTTNQGLDAIKDVFIFVEDESELKIDVIDDGGRLDIDSGYRRIGEILIERGDLTQADLTRILTVKQPIGQMLVEAGVVSPSQIQAALLEQQHVQEVREQRQKTVEGQSIRVPSERLDKLVDLVGEIVTVQARLSQFAARDKNTELLSISEEVERLTADLRDNTMSTRMVPIGTLFNKFHRLVRDLARELGKEVEMHTEGAETELDKTVIERLNDPLIHLIRNCIDHGIEKPAPRLKVGKPEKGMIELSARHSGAFVFIRIKDDGAGLDPQRILAKAVEKGIISPGIDLPEAEMLNLIFMPGFSTAERISGVSGRGVGMDVVKRNIEALKGTIELKSQPKIGTEVILKLPLTLAIIDGLLVNIGRAYFVIPVSVVLECVELTARDLTKAHGRNTVTVRNELIPYIHLRKRFDLNGRRPDIEQVVITEIQDQRLGLVVDRVIGDHQTVIKSLGPFFKKITDISGATILGDGNVALIIDVPRLLAAVETEQARSN